MYADLVLIKKEEYIKNFANYLGFNKLFFKEDLKKLKIQLGSDINQNRKYIESKKINILLNPHIKSTNKLKEISTGLNQVLLKLAKKNKIIIGLSLDQFSNTNSLEKIRKIIKLCRKYKVNICIFSLAKSKYQLKSVQDIQALLRITGMTPGEAKSALNNVLNTIK